MSTMDQFVNHLEFLGYEVERRDGDLIKAKHQSNANFLFHIFGFGAMAKAMFGVNSQGKNRRGDVLERLNSYNSVARVSRAYIDKDFDLAIDCLLYTSPSPRDS